MIKAIISDFSRVLLFPKEKNYQGSLNALHNGLLAHNKNYDFLATFTLNSTLLAHLSSLNKQLPVYIFTSEAIQDHPAIQQQIKSATTKVFSASKLGVKKSNPESYKTLLNSLSLKGDEVVFIDDDQSNLDQAAKSSIHTILYRENSTTIKQLSAVIKTAS